MMACAILAAPAAAQYRKAAELMYAIGSSYAKDIRDEAGQQVFDESKIRDSVTRLCEASQNAARALVGFGEPLANAAKSPYEDVLSEPFKRVKNIMNYQLDRELPEKCDAVLKLLATNVNNRPKDYYDLLSSQLTGLAVMADARYSDWQKYAELIDKTRRWLEDSQKQAASDRDRSMQDCRPIIEAQNAAWAKLKEAEAAEKRADEEHSRALESLVAAESKENETCVAWCEVVANNGTSENIWQARQRWEQASGQESEALVNSLVKFQAWASAREDLKSAYAQLVTAQKQLRDFAGLGDANKVVEQFNRFTLWKDLLERDINR